jgi:hypothetical protein
MQVEQWKWSRRTDYILPRNYVRYKIMHNKIHFRNKILTFLGYLQYTINTFFVLCYFRGVRITMATFCAIAFSDVT